MLKNITRIIPFLIMTLLCIGGTELFYNIAERYLSVGAGMTAVSQGEKRIAGHVAEKVEKHKDYSVIVQRNLFKSFVEEPKPVKLPEEKAPVILEATQLDISLVGTITGKDGKGRAIIKDKRGGKQELYYQGDVVQGAEIKEIHRKKIILSFNGKDEILQMDESNGVSAVSAGGVSPFPKRERILDLPQDGKSRAGKPERSVSSRALRDKKRLGPVEERLDSE